MTAPGKFGLIGTLSLLSLVGTVTASSAADDALAWPPITSQTKPWVWWWWHGSAVDQTNIAHELQRFHDAGLGGVQITAIFGTKGAEARDIPYLTPAWLDMMGYTVDEAQRLDMGVTMTLGTGWCFGGPTVSDQDANATVVVRLFNVAAGQKLEGKFNRDSTQALVAFSADGKSIELTDKISADGTVDWTVPAGSWKVYAISQKPSGQKVKRAAPGGEGWMLNPAYPQAVRDWLKWFDAAFANYTGPKPQAVFQDSYECRTDWSPDFFAQFEKLRGYRLQTELPALFDNQSDDRTARVKYDYRRTLSDIMAGQSEPAWIDWAHKNGFQTIYQAHGTPGNWLDLYGDADMPETEMFHNDRSILVSKFASSAAHTQGHPLTGAETGTWLEEHFTETLAELKYLADDMFLAGVNRIFYHGACYSPDDAPWPGWLFYASTEMNSRNSIWRDVPALNEYVARCQSILQSGQPDNDVLLYWPVADFWSQPSGRVQAMTVSQTAWFEDQPIGKTAHELWNRGYAFDYVSDRQLQAVKDVKGKIFGGNYNTILVPECKYIPVKTFKKLLELAASGHDVFFSKQLPTDVSGRTDLENERAEFKKLRDQIHLVAGEPLYAQIGSGYIMVGSKLEGFPAFREPMADDGLSFVRRLYTNEALGGSFYLIANRSGNNFEGWTTIGRVAGSAIIFDPMTGRSGVTKLKQVGGQTRVYLQLPAGSSIILKTSFVENDYHGPAWTTWQTNGQPSEITGNWNAKFVSGGPTMPADFQTAQLASWTTFPDTNCQAFAGTAKYTLEFNLQVAPNTLKRELQHYYLDLGDVRQSARVTLNGKDYGTLITPPFRAVVDNLKPTGNQLEVEVTSVSANRIRDLDRRGVQWKIFKDINFVNVNYRPFNAADWPLTDCGLLGPVTLTALTTVTK